MYYQLVPDQTPTTSRGSYYAELQQGSFLVNFGTSQSMFKIIPINFPSTVNTAYIKLGSDGHLKIFHHSNANGLREIVDMITHDLGECQHPHPWYNNNVSDGYCYTPSTVLTIREGLIPNHSFAFAKFVKVQIPYKAANGQAKGTVPDTSPPTSRRNLKAIIARSCAGAKDFKERLGGGAFGTVFKEMLEEGTQIAAKRLDKLGQEIKEFFAEVETFGHIHHVNLVRLIGFCTKKSCRLLVYEYMTNGSLDNWIFWNNQRPCLNWQSAKISNFGLSKLINRDESHVLTTMRKTLGCIAPEWRQARVTIKADIYSFGIVLLEIVSGRRNFDSTQSKSRKHLLQVLRERAEYELLDMVENMDEGVKQYHAEEVVRMIKIGAWCL
ncbi:G-type lectin S-receptor-like serine/threonine-protein kinase At5g24080 [Camellia sinensis]|uniref:G-type lectin S-receptor-like serine/threonine-protein kinase At5g24080 n=1 Tax=Camellia sinensis TaxID=4442 RepID=UPI00103604EB|nr:G-type lectin S-receptor-like serine/threonine-protein kinase At5g24080 [Camellia sinensis]